MADPSFMVKLAIECGIGVCTKCTAEYTKRQGTFSQVLLTPAAAVAVMVMAAAVAAAAAAKPNIVLESTVSYVMTTGSTLQPC
jgi:hypothetical protein